MSAMSMGLHVAQENAAELEQKHAIVWSFALHIPRECCLEMSRQGLQYLFCILGKLFDLVKVCSCDFKEGTLQLKGSWA